MQKKKKKTCCNISLDLVRASCGALEHRSYIGRFYTILLTPTTGRGARRRQVDSKASIEEPIRVGRRWEFQGRG